MTTYVLSVCAWKLFRGVRGSSFWIDVCASITLLHPPGQNTWWLENTNIQLLQLQMGEINSVDTDAQSLHDSNAIESCTQVVKYYHKTTPAAHA